MESNPIGVEVGVSLMMKMNRVKAYVAGLERLDALNFKALVNLPVSQLRALKKNASTDKQKEFIVNALSYKACVILLEG